jgi:hypothetical protein
MTTPIIERRDRLIVELTDDREKARAAVKPLDRNVRWCRWGTIFALSCASTLGFVATIPLLRDSIAPWVISAFALAASGIEILRQRMAWRDKAKAWYARRDEVHKLIDRLQYQLPESPTADQIARIAEEFGKVRDRFGERMREIEDRNERTLDKPKAAG